MYNLPPAGAGNRPAGSGGCLALGRGIIDSITKSLDRLSNELKDIETPDDAEPKAEKKDEGSKKQSSGST
jgi:hypothetical protein